MEDRETRVGSAAASGSPVQGWMLPEDIVREVLARLARHVDDQQLVVEESLPQGRPALMGRVVSPARARPSAVSPMRRAGS